MFGLYILHHNNPKNFSDPVNNNLPMIRLKQLKHITLVPAFSSKQYQLHA